MDTPNLMNAAHCPLAFPEYLPALQLAIGVTEFNPATSDGSEQPGTPTEVNKVKGRKPYTITKQRERWSQEEHQRFLEALKLHGRAWRKIEEHVGSKTAVQIRSHAQKFFHKLEKNKDEGEAPISIPPPRPKKKPSRPYPRKSVANEGCKPYKGDTSGIGGVSRVGAGATQAFGGTPGTSDDLPSSPQLTGSFAENEVTEATVAAVAAAASAAAAAAAAAVVAAAGQQVQAHLQVHPPQGFPFFGMPPSLLAQLTALQAPPVEVTTATQGVAHKGQRLIDISSWKSAAAAAADRKAMEAAAQVCSVPMVEATGTTDGTRVIGSHHLRGSDGDSACSRENASGSGDEQQTGTNGWHTHSHQQDVADREQATSQQHQPGWPSHGWEDAADTANNIVLYLQHLATGVLDGTGHVRAPPSSQTCERSWERKTLDSQRSAERSGGSTASQLKSGNAQGAAKGPSDGGVSAGNSGSAGGSGQGSGGGSGGNSDAGSGGNSGGGRGNTGCGGGANLKKERFSANQSSPDCSNTLPQPQSPSIQETDNKAPSPTSACNDCDVHPCREAQGSNPSNINSASGLRPDSGSGLAQNGNGVHRLGSNYNGGGCSQGNGSSCQGIGNGSNGGSSLGIGNGSNGGSSQGVANGGSRASSDKAYGSREKGQSVRDSNTHGKGSVYSCGTPQEGNGTRKTQRSCALPPLRESTAEHGTTSCWHPAQLLTSCQQQQQHAAVLSHLQRISASGLHQAFGGINHTTIHDPRHTASSRNEATGGSSALHAIISALQAQASLAPYLLQVAAQVANTSTPTSRPLAAPFHSSPPYCMPNLLTPHVAPLPIPTRADHGPHLPPPPCLSTALTSPLPSAVSLSGLAHSSSRAAAGYHPQHYLRAATPPSAAAWGGAHQQGTNANLAHPHVASSAGLPCGPPLVLRSAAMAVEIASRASPLERPMDLQASFHCGEKRPFSHSQLSQPLKKRAYL